MRAYVDLVRKSGCRNHLGDLGTDEVGCIKTDDKQKCEFELNWARSW
jgi:hypothetical protein